MPDDERKAILCLWTMAMPGTLALTGASAALADPGADRHRQRRRALPCMPAARDLGGLL